MGLLRFILAISVVLAHAGNILGCTLVGGVAAVQIFFMISGFYMSLVLNEKYTNIRLFFSNRLLKLFPMYWAVLALTIITLLSGTILNKGGGSIDVWISNWECLNIKTSVFMIFANILIVGQDAIMFLGIDISNGSLFLTNDFTKTNPGVFTFLFVPQAWSLSIEIMFYLIIPFIINSKYKHSILVITFIFSLILRVVLYFYGLYLDPWAYRFFPTEILFFIAGSFAYDIYKNNMVELKPYYYKVIYFFTFTFIVLYSLIPDMHILHFNVKQWFLYLWVFSVIPYLFILTKNTKIDNLIGELSYPIYICHVFVIYTINAVNKIIAINSDAKVVIVIFITIIFSMLLNKYIQEPINNFRKKRLIQVSV